MGPDFYGNMATGLLEGFVEKIGRQGETHKLLHFSNKP